MHLPYTYKKCILCGSAGRLTKEDVIPECLGGILKIKFLCGDCNNRLGGDLISFVKNDDRIRLALRQVAGTIKLIARLSKGQEYLVWTRHGAVRCTVGKTNVITVDTQGINEPEKPCAEAEARQYVQDALDKQPATTGYPKIGADFMDQTPGSIQPALTGSRMSDLVPLVMAFEFLAVNVGQRIYDSEFDELRNAIRNRHVPTNLVRITPLHAQQYRPIHGLAMIQGQPLVKVRICLFRWINYIVEFLAVQHEGERYIYELDLKESTERLEPL